MPYILHIHNWILLIELSMAYDTLELYKKIYLYSLPKNNKQKDI